MTNLISDVLRQWHAMYRYRLLGLLTAWVIAVVGALIVFAIPKKYEANARVFVNTDSILKPLMVGMAVQADAGQRVALLSRLVINRPNVEELIAKTYPAIAKASVEERERLIDTISSALEISGSGGRDNIYFIRYRDTKQDRAKQMVELLVAKFITSSTGGVASDSKSAREFLDEQVATYEAKLKEAETNLKEFKLRNIAAGDDMNYSTQLATASEQLNAAQLQLHEAEISRDTFRRGMNLDTPGEATSAPRLVDNAARLDLDARIDKTRLELETLLTKYTDKHPDVLVTRHALADMLEQRRQIPATTRAEVRAGLDAPPVIGAMAQRNSEQLGVSLVQAEAMVAALKVRVADYAARYAQLQAMARRMPEFEAEMAQLNREYDVNKKNYDSLVMRRESASIAGDMQTVSGVGDFRVIDPPRVSPTAVSTSRTKLLAATIVMATLIGLAVMFMAKEIRSRIYDLAQLKRLTSIPVLGTVSVVKSPRVANEARWRNVRFHGLAVTLAVIYSGVIFVGLTRFAVTA